MTICWKSLHLDWGHLTCDSEAFLLVTCLELNSLGIRLFGTTQHIAYNCANNNIFTGEVPSGICNTNVIQIISDENICPDTFDAPG